MANMSYCMFRNTVDDMEQVIEEYDNQAEDISKEEDEARLQLIELCKEFLEIADTEPLYDDSKFDD